MDYNTSDVSTHTHRHVRRRRSAGGDAGRRADGDHRL